MFLLLTDLRFFTEDIGIVKNRKRVYEQAKNKNRVLWKKAA